MRGMSLHSHLYYDPEEPVCCLLTNHIWIYQDPHFFLMDIMVLSAQDPDSSHHEFDYARVIGIFHVNVIYTGPGMVDYRSRRLDFLWVRWFENLDDVPASKGWETGQLDTLRFLPMSDDDAFGFLDPSQVLRASHLIQSFVADRRHMDGRGISECAKNTQDWHQYLVNR